MDTRLFLRLLNDFNLT
jgi:hypothetical protein